jgi:predicted CopG family antitoxin
MPPRNYSNITVRREVREELEKLREELGVRDFSDLLALLVAKYREYTSVTSKLLQQLTSISSKVDELLTRVSSIATSNASISPSGKTPATSISSTATSVASSRGSVIEVLKKQKITCLSDLARAGKKMPERIVEKAKMMGAVVVRTDEDVCAVYPEFWDLFKKKLNESKTPDDKEVLSRLNDEKMKKLFQLLRKAGALYLDAKSKEWVFDYGFIEEPGGVKEKENVEEEVAVDWEYT